MRYNLLGRTGLYVSELCLGTMTFGGAGFWQTIGQLQLEHVDLYQLHGYDPLTPPEEYLSTLDDMVRSGKVRYIGASQYQAWQVCRCNDLAERHGWARFITVQIHYNLLERQAEEEMLPFCREMKVGFLPYFALANGLLAGRYSLDTPPPADSRAAAFDRTRRYLDKYGTAHNFAIIDRLSQWARQRDHSLADLAIAWPLAEPVVPTVITGASSPQQIVANARAGSWALGPTDLAEIRAILEG